jgi:hypothetical protein
LEAQKEAMKRRLEGHALAYVYFEEQRLICSTRGEVRRIAANFAGP